jgi:hypothetical protein
MLFLFVLVIVVVVVGLVCTGISVGARCIIIIVVFKEAS